MLWTGLVEGMGEECIQDFGRKTLNEKDHREDLDGNIILQ
jgi:hypothetical protein